MMKVGQIVKGTAVRWDPYLLELAVELDTGEMGLVPLTELTMYYNPSDDGFCRTAAYCIGKSLEYEILKTYPIILGRKNMAKRKLEKIKANPNKIYTGTITNIKPMYIFVDISGVQGICGIQELTYSRVPNTNWIVKPGMELKFKILNFNEDDKLVLSHKSVFGTLQEIINTYSPGELLSARISNRVDPLKDIDDTDSYFVLIDKIATGIVDIPKDVEVFAGDIVTVEVKKITDKGLRVAFVNF